MDAPSQTEPTVTRDSPLRAWLHRWLFEHNPLYLLSAALVLAGLTLMSREAARDGSVAGILGVSAIAELYSLALIGGAAFLVRLGRRRPAVMLGLLVVAYQGDLTLHVETCAYLGTAGEIAAVLWALLFVAKLLALAWALELRPSRSAVLVPALGAAGMAILPQLLPAADPNTRGVLVTLWLFALAIGALWSTRDVSSAVPWDARGRRCMRATWAIWGVLALVHVCYWAGSWEVPLAVAVPALPLLALRWAHHCGECANACSAGFGCLDSVCFDSIVAVAAGQTHTCAVRSSGAVLCWGNNDYGQLGDGSTTSSRSPVTVGGLTDAVDVAVGSRHSCVLRSTGSVACWGTNARGQLGDGGTVASGTPVEVSDITGAEALVTGYWHTCALTSTGSVWCWGDDTTGQLGDGSSTGALVPVEVAGLSDIRDIAAGGYFSCAANASGEVYCWGGNATGQLGSGSTASFSPQLVPDVSGARGVTAGYGHACSWTSTGTVSCWGANDRGQLGIGVTSTSRSPTMVVGIGDAQAVVAGGQHTCIRRSSGLVACAGDNTHGQLGDGSFSASNTPVAVVDSEAMITLGPSLFTFGCAADDQGRPWCWGANENGQLGNGTTMDSNIPAVVLGL